MQWVDTAPTQLRQAATVDLRTGDAVIVLDRVGTCIGVDDGLEPIVGIDAAHLLGRSLIHEQWRWCEPDGRPVSEQDSPVTRALASGEPVEHRVLGLEAVGQFAWVEVSAHPLRAEDGSVDGVATSLRDVSQTPQGRAATAGMAGSLRLLASASAADEARFRTLAENSADVLFQTDIVGRCVWVSPSLGDVLGFAPEEVLGQSLVRLLHPSDREIANERRMVALAESGGGHDRVELRYATAAGTWQWMSVVSRPLRDPTGRVVGAVSALHDIQDEVQRRDESLYRAGRDPLTGLLDRDAGRHALTKALVAVHGTDRLVGVLLVDIDGLERLNLEHGTPAGDLAITHVAAVLTAHLRATDSVARLGADDFLVVLSSLAAPDHAERRAQSLLELVAAPRVGSPSVRVSIGVAVDDGTTAAVDVLRRADVGLLHAKEAGGGQVRV